MAEILIVMNKFCLIKVQETLIDFSAFQNYTQFTVMCLKINIVGESEDRKN